MTYIHFFLARSFVRIIYIVFITHSQRSRCLQRTTRSQGTTRPLAASNIIRSSVRTIYIIFITRSQRSQCLQRSQCSQCSQRTKRPLAACRKRLLNRTLARAHTHTLSTVTPDVKILSNLGGKSNVIKKQFGNKNKLIIWHYSLENFLDSTARCLNLREKSISK